jgi:RNA polymerase sigma-70 factor, ECF subfamily
LSKKVTYNQEELVVLIRKGDQKAFAYLYDNYSEALFGVIYKIVSSHEEAEDVLQQSFIKIWNNFNSYDELKGRLYTWMLNISRNLAIDSTRSKHEKIKSKIQNDADFVYERNHPFSENTTHEYIGFDALLTSLKEEEKELINLVYYQGYTQEEIAKKISIPLGTVKTKIRKAIIKLREVTSKELNPSGY